MVDAARDRTGRLRSSREVRAVFAERRAAPSQLAVVYARIRGGSTGPRVAVVAGRTVGPAVDRNRVKRRLRAALRELPLRDGHDYVAVGRRAALVADSAQLRAVLAAQVERVSR